MDSKKILVVDDEQDIADLLAKKLESEGFETIKAYRGYDAVEKVKLFLPDIILMDILLPDMDGAEVVRIIQKHPATKNIPIVFLSGIVTEDRKGSPEQIVVGDRRYDAIGKPFEFNELMEVIQKLI